MEELEDRVCLDTDFLVNFLRNKKEEVEFIKNNEDNILLATTLINLFELYYGAYKSGVKTNIDSVEELTYKLEVLNLTQEVVRKAGEVLSMLERKGEVVDFRDLLIGCTAHMEGFCIKTHNKRHFEKIPGLIVR